ncbi:MAG: 6-bladed beta-propeller [Bacteroidota bacterium]|nr:6-bladed beta-propeller [Bacteroidota bacterium]
MMKYLFYSVFVFLIVFAGCQNQQENHLSEQVITIRKNTIPKPSVMSELMKSVRLIPLETNNDCLMSHIFQLEFHNDMIFIIDFPTKNGVLVFDKEGRFLRSIGREGKGPGEYTDMASFSILTGANRIYLNDRGARKTSEYDLDGNFIRDIQTPVKPADLRFVSENKYFVHYPKDYYLRLIDMKVSEPMLFIPHVNGYNGYGKAIYTQSDQSYLYSPSYHDSIYSLEEDSIVLQYAFEFGPYQWSGEDQVAEYARTKGMSYPANKLTPAGPYFDFGNLFYFLLFIEDKDNRYTIDPFLWMKEDEKLIRLGDDSDDILFCSSAYPVAITPQNEWVAPLGAYELIESKDKIKQNQSFRYSKKLLQQIENLKEDDNPVLAIFELK